MAMQNVTSDSSLNGDKISTSVYAPGDISSYFSKLGAGGSLDSTINETVAKLFSTPTETKQHDSGVIEPSQMHLANNVVANSVDETSIELTMRERLGKGLKRARLVENEYRAKRKFEMEENLLLQNKKLRPPRDLNKASGILHKNTVANNQIDISMHNLIEADKLREAEDAERMKEITRRTIFVGNITLDTKPSCLRQALKLQKSQIESIRFRSIPVDPKFAKQRAWAAATGKFSDMCHVKNAYIVLTKEQDVKSLLDPQANFCLPSGIKLRLSSVSFNRRTFSTFPRRSTVFVGNLYVKTTEDDLRKVFEENVGAVVNVRIIRDSTIFASKGFGFVHFADRSYVPKAIQKMNGFILNKRPLNVTKAMAEDLAKKADQDRQQLVQNKLTKKKDEKLQQKLDKHKMKKLRKTKDKKKTNIIV